MHVVVVYSFSSLCSIACKIYCNLFVQSVLGGHMYVFYVLALMNTAALNFLVLEFW